MGKISILMVLVILIGIGLIYLAYIIWPENGVYLISTLPSMIIGGLGFLSFSLTTWILHGKDEWLNMVLDL